MKISYSADDLCRIVQAHAAANNPFRPGHASLANLVVRDSDGLCMTDDCDVMIEVELGEVTDPAERELARV